MQAHYLAYSALTYCGGHWGGIKNELSLFLVPQLEFLMSSNTERDIIALSFVHNSCFREALVMRIREGISAFIFGTLSGHHLFSLNFMTCFVVQNPFIF